MGTDKDIVEARELKNDEIINTEAEASAVDGDQPVAKKGKGMIHAFRKKGNKTMAKTGSVTASGYNSLSTNFGTFVNTRVEGLEYNKKARDPHHLHDNLKVSFQDVIAEPEGTTSFEQVWSTSYKSYAKSRSCCYKLLSSVCGIPMALFWGLYFALLAFFNIWCMVPAVKGCQIQMKFIEQIWGMVVGTIFDPMFSSLGKVFSNIRITMVDDRRGKTNIV